MSLTPEQSGIAFGPPTVRALVTAGPGTGKTHALVARVQYLVDGAELAPGSEILVLSFSRAAVREITHRLRDGQHGGAAYVRARTFDSFATRLLSEIDPEGDWIKYDYDGRIAELVRRLSEPRALSALAHIRHIVIDEVQDLVGKRAALVKALLGRDGVFFTVFGDPAQAIYDFATRGSTNCDDVPGDFYRWIRERFPDLHEVNFSDNFRVQSDVARAALHCGCVLAAASEDVIVPDLKGVLARLETWKTLENASYYIQRSVLRTAILTRTNREALVVSGELHRLGIAHRLQQPATSRVVGRWVCDLLRGADGRFLQRDYVESACLDLQMSPGLDNSRVWRLLRRLGGSDDPRQQRIEIHRIVQSLAAGRVPDEMLAPDEQAMVVVSTIHRAKGLEFDRVLIVEPSVIGGDVDKLAEARVLYVALTRARSILIHLEPINTRDIHSLGAPEDRHYVGGPKKYHRFGFEFKSHDLNSAPPASGLSRDGGLDAVQRYISAHIRDGDVLHLELEDNVMPDGEAVAYRVYHEGTLVAVTSPRFASALYRALKIDPRWTVKWPPRISGARVQCLETVAASVVPEEWDLPGPPVWLNIRPQGLGRLEHKGMGQ
jgi:hypothetical protein